MSVPVQSSLPYSPDARIDFGWIGQAWTLFKAQSGVWVGTLFLSFLINTGIFALLALPTGMFAPLQSVYDSLYLHVQAPPAPAPNPYLEFAQNQAFSILFGGISAIFAGGLFRMALRQQRGEPISVSHLFSAFPQGLPLFLLGTVIPVVLGIMEGAFKWPLHRFVPHTSVVFTSNVSIAINTLLNSLLMFAPLFVLETNASVPDAILRGFRLLRGQLLRGIGFYLYASFVGVIGLLGCGVGMLATYPIFVLSIAIGYVALTGTLPEAVPFDPAPVGVWPPPPRTE